MENETPPDVSPIEPYRSVFDSDPDCAFIAIRDHIGGAMWPGMRFFLERQPCAVCFFSMLKDWGITDERYARVAYNHFFGRGRWDEVYTTQLASHKQEAFDKGFAAAQAVLTSQTGLGIVSYKGDFPEDYKSGMGAAAEQHNAGKMQ